ncbi:DUF6531 domain-containing protein [Taklimakanibacter deserti]|uniref:DUF6531 domain-containing protein n=1 Tax=Taklimakanibacter deserti TaxID=2267839 RepID=UPI000E64BDA7
MPEGYADSLSSPPEGSTEWWLRQISLDLKKLYGEGHYKDPCSAAEEFYNNNVERDALGTPTGKLVFKEDSEKNTWQLLTRACEEFKLIHGGTPEPKPKPTRVTKATATNPDVPPPESDTPEHQGAPDVEVWGLLSIRPKPAHVTLQTAPYRVYDPTEPIPAEEIPQRLEPTSPAGPPPPPDDSELIRRLLVNEPLPEQRSWSHSGQIALLPVGDGDPVDLFTGALTISEVDFDIPTPFLPLRLVRMYRSGLPYFGPWGFNWDHNYNVYLRELSDGGIALWSGSLHEDYFRWTGDAFEPDYGVHKRLERLGEKQYRLTHSGGVTWEFAYPENWSNLERIPLLDIFDRHRNRIKLGYDGENRLHHVRDEAGRGLFFHYGTCNLLEAIEDHSGKRRVEYWHHPEIEHLVGVKTLPTATYPKGATTCYEYDFLNPHPAARHNLRRVVDAEGQTYLQNEYGGPEAGWAFNRITQQLHGDFLYQFEYEQIQYVPEDPVYADVLARRTVVHPPDGSLHTYTFNYRGDLINYRFRLNRDGSYRVVVYAWEYDTQGNMTKEIGPAVTTHFEYDHENQDPCARGNLRNVALESRLMPDKRTMFQGWYDPIYQLPLLIRDENDQATQFEYDIGVGATGRLRRIELPTVTLPEDGGTQECVTRLETNSRGQVMAMISPGGVRDELYYYPKDQQQPPSGSSEPKPPILEGFIKTLIQDVAGVAYKTEYTYDAAGLPAKVSKPAGVVTEFIYNALGQLEEKALPAVAGSVARTRTNFTREGVPLRVERPRGDYADSVITQDAIVDEYRLDILGNVKELILGANTNRPRNTKFYRDHAGRARETIDPTGTRAQRCFDERGLLLEETIGAETAEALTTRLTYDVDGSLRRVKEPNGTVTEVTKRDLWRRPLEMRLANGALKKFEWQPMDRLGEIRVEEEPGDGTRILAREQFDYDERGRLIRERVHIINDNPGGTQVLSTTYVYDPDDRLRRIRMPRGGILKFDYDGVSRLVHAEDVFGNVETTVYGTNNNLATVTRKEIEPGGTRTTSWQYEYDSRRRLEKITSPGGAEVTHVHDDRNLIVERREPLGVITKYRYGLLGELEQKLLDPTGLNIKSEYKHDLLGRLTHFVDPIGETTQWHRDAIGRIVDVVLPDGSHWQQSFNSQGQLATRTTPAGSQFLFTYYAHSGELRSIECVPGIVVLAVPKHEFAYDLLGRQVQASFPNHTVVQKFDSVGRLVAESSQGKTLQVRFDDLAGQVDLVYPDGRVERTTVDLGGRPTQVSLVTPGSLGGTPDSFIAQFVYAGRDRLHSIVTRNGITAELVYDDALRLIRLGHTKAGQVLESCRYRYDRRNRRRLMQLLGPPQSNRLHRFDSRDRLNYASSDFPLAQISDAATQQEQDLDIAAAEQASAAAQRKETFSLDDADRRQQRQLMLSSSSINTLYNYATGHKVTQIGSETILYSADGPREKDGKHRYDIDALGRIVQIREAASGSVQAKFTYDPLSRPARMDVGGQTYQRWFRGSRWVHEERFPLAGVRQMTPHPLWPSPIEQRTTGSTTTLHFDGLFSTLFVTDATGAVVERDRFDVFGKESRFMADGITPFSVSVAESDPIFGAMPLLSALGLYETPARLYDPEHGLFISRDPKLYADGPSPYLYALHNPADFVDPRGTDKKASDDFVRQTIAVLRATERPEYRAAFMANLAAQRPDLFKASAVERGVTNVVLGIAVVGGAILAVPSGGSSLAVAGAFVTAFGGGTAIGFGAIQITGGLFGGVSAEEAEQIDVLVSHTSTIFDPYSGPAYLTIYVLTGDADRALHAGMYFGLLSLGSGGKVNYSRLYAAHPGWNVGREAAMNRALKMILADPEHPLRFLVNPTTKDWMARSHLSELPAVQAGHKVSRWTGEPEFIGIEEAFPNQWTGWRGERGKRAWWDKEFIDVRGIPVEAESAKGWAAQPEGIKLLPFISPR